jgi:hypothetical protein
MKVRKLWIWLSMLIAILVATASWQGIVHDNIYYLEKANWMAQINAQDFFDLILVFPIFLISTYFVSQKSLMAFFVWLGTLMFIIYSYILYAFFVHFTYLFPIYVAVLGLSFYTLIGMLLTVNLAPIAKIVTGVKLRRVISLFLVILGLMFAFLWLSEIIPAILVRQIPKSVLNTGFPVNPVQVIDLAIVLPGLTISGILFWEQKLLGKLFAGVFLVFAVIMSFSIIGAIFIVDAQGASSGSILIPLIMNSLIILIGIILAHLFFSQTRSTK